VTATSQPVEGSSPTLARNAIGLPEVLFQSITHMAPAVATALSIGAATAFAGGITPLAVVFAMIAVLFTASSMAQLAKHLPSAGGMYTYVGAGLGSFFGWLVAWSFAFAEPLARPALRDEVDALGRAARVDELGRLAAARQPARDDAVEPGPVEQRTGREGLRPALLGQGHVVGRERAARLVEVRDRAVAHEVEPPPHAVLRLSVPAPRPTDRAIATETTARSTSVRAETPDSTVIRCIASTA